ncbi:MAG: HigA family addiction module antidote protein [Cyanobacterium sp. T60_A2020_053]|nr:HigA family addiction module antidote protein [Cyanobacterium sp. T60_A2020_053]
MTMNEKLKPIHPGEILLEEFIKPLDLTTPILAKDINLSLKLIEEIILEKQSITTEIGLRLSKYFGLSERFWLNLQLKYDLEITKDKLEETINSEVKTISI